MPTPPAAGRMPHMQVPTEHLRMAFTLANHKVLQDITSGSVPVWLDWPGRSRIRAFDTRPMIDPREHCNDVLDMAAQALCYGEALGLFERHPVQRYLVRLVEPIEGAN